MSPSLKKERRRLRQRLASACVTASWLRGWPWRSLALRDGPPGEDGVLPGWEWACLDTYANGHTGGPALRKAELFQDAPSPMWCAIAGDNEGTTGEPRLPFAVQGFPPRVLYVGPPEVYSKFWWLGP